MTTETDTVAPPPLTTISTAVHDQLGRNAHTLSVANKAVWDGLQAVQGTATAMGVCIRELASDTAQQSGGSVQRIVIAGQAFARAKNPADLMSAQQAMFRTSSSAMADSMLKIQATLARTARAMSSHWPISVASTKVATPSPAEG